MFSSFWEQMQIIDEKKKYTSTFSYLYISRKQHNYTFNIQVSPLRMIKCCLLEQPNGEKSFSLVVIITSRSK